MGALTAGAGLLGAGEVKRGVGLVVTAGVRVTVRARRRGRDGGGGGGGAGTLRGSVRAWPSEANAAACGGRGATAATLPCAEPDWVNPPRAPYGSAKASRIAPAAIQMRFARVTGTVPVACPARCSR